MILVLGSQNYEQGTNPVLDWLIYHKADFVKLTIHSLFSDKKQLRAEVNDQKIYYQNICLNDHVRVIWYRHFLDSRNSIIDKSTLNGYQINRELCSEIMFFTDFVYESLKDKKWLSPYPSIQVNKLTMLRRACDVGLKVPETRILNSRKDALKFLYKQNSGGHLIIKQFSDRSRSYYRMGNLTYFSYAKALCREEIQKLDDFFFPTLFQQKVDTEYEIRVFYLDKQFFSSAILSESGYSVDDRKKITGQPGVHVVKYNLPQPIEAQLIKLMDASKLIIGAIDLIKSKNGHYYFLEVNPIGQYLYESEKCNFHIAEHIAEYLMKWDIN